MIPSACPFVHSRSTAIAMGIVQCKSTRECAQTNPCISDPKSDRRRSLTTLSAPTSLASLQQAPTFSSRAVLAGFAPPPSHAYDPLTDPAHDPAVDPPSSASALDAVGSMSSASSTVGRHEENFPRRLLGSELELVLRLGLELVLGLGPP